VIGVDRTGHAAELHDAGADQVLSDLSELDLTTLGLTVGWQTIFEGFEPATEGQREALCALGNGYFVTRGAVPEAEIGGPFYPATYIAGVLNRPPGSPEQRETETETIVNAPNWLSLRFRVGAGDWFDLRSTTLLSQRHELDVRTGMLVRHLRVRDEAGRVTRVTQRRLVSMTDEHLAALESTFLAENWTGTLVVESALDGRVTNSNVERYRPFEASHLSVVDVTDSGEVIRLVVETVQSHIRIAEAARTRVVIHGSDEVAERSTVREDAVIAHTFTIAMERGRPVTVEKVVAIYTSRDQAISEPDDAAAMDVARAPGFAGLLARHETAWRHLWRRSRIEIEDGADDAARILDLHLFHLLQTVSENTVELDVGVPARGLHGEGYRGHIFWDELMIFPFLNLRFPELTRALLLYRYRRLRQARWAAEEAGYRGAMFPWQSGSDGRDETPRMLFNPRSGRWMPDNSRLQRHVGIAVAYNVWLYYQVTDDIEFMSFYGAELILEIARFFASLAEYSHTRDRYEIRGVMGPDEYHDGYPDRETPGLDNNAYTNVMTAWLLMRALETVELLPERQRERVCDRIELHSDELQRWEEITRKLYVPIDADGIISQFEGYGRLQEFDWAGYRARYGHIERLDLILEAEGDSPNRYKLSKQPDVLMLFYLLSAAELQTIFDRLRYPFPPDTIARNIEYYEQRTAHGSTLSRVVTSWVLSRINRVGSWSLFRESLRSDVEDIQGGTTREGIHLGAMAGTVDLVQRCYTGIETRDNVLWIDPRLPAELRAIRFDVHYRHHWVEVEVLPERVRLATRPGRAAPIRVGYRGDVVEIGPGQTHEFELIGS
jgi:alpha,alpha-trehalase